MQIQEIGLSALGFKLAPFVSPALLAPLVLLVFVSPLVSFAFFATFVPPV